MKIRSIKAEKILDSRGDWTSRAVVELEDGAKGFGEVPSGASLGEKEAVLLPVDQAIDHINDILGQKMVGQDAYNQNEVDNIIIQTDGTPNKANLGANASLPVSLGVCEAASASQKIPLYQYIAKSFGFEKTQIPTPLFNIINGGAHANNKLAIQEFMIAPGTSHKFNKALDLGVKVYHQLEKMLATDDLSTEVGDEGGFAPVGLNSYKACEYLVEAGRTAGFVPGRDFFIAIDAAANEFGKGGRYTLPENNRIRSGEDLLNLYVDLSKMYPIIYLEDPFTEDDISSWQKGVLALGKNMDIVGDDLTVTNTKLLEEAIKNEAITGVIVKPNQIGTLTETISYVKKAQEHNLVITVSHRSGETGEDTFISDLATAVGARYIKAGAPARGERVVKYNRLLEIYHEFHPSGGIHPTGGIAN
ncbi:MAG: enolase [bacterium]